jgi:mono/diheme cytochrome c family protein
MTRAVVNGALAIALLALIGITMLQRADFFRRNWQYFPGMVDAVAYDPQSDNSVWADGKTQQPPVQGTVARGFPPFPYAATPEDALRAGAELQPPHTADSVASLTRGQVVYTTFCVPCHGAKGMGDGIVTTRGFPPPPSLLADHARQLKDGNIYHIITLGQNSMPALAGQVAREDRWNVMRYVRSMQAVVK